VVNRIKQIGFLGPRAIGDPAIDVLFRLAAFASGHWPWPGEPLRFASGPLPEVKEAEPTFPLLPVRDVYFSTKVLGDIAAGDPLFVEDESTDVFDFREMFGGPGIYMLRVRGKSMEDAAIMDGDYVVIRIQEAAPVGSIVVAVVNKAYTLKKLVKCEGGITEVEPQAKGGKKTRIRLDPEIGDCIIGKLVGVVRKV
jgi:phage repressor protein C with HTH and peptisase S24 domain